MSRRPGRQLAAGGVLLALTLVPAGCRAAGGRAAAAPSSPAPSSVSPATPSTAAALGRLLVAEVPSGRPLMPDAELRPRAGEKTLDDVAAYAQDPVHEREVLSGYGFRWGWERFWGAGAGSPETSVLVEQFTGTAGARSFTDDLAANEARRYRAGVHENPPALPSSCRLLTVDAPSPDLGLGGPTAMAECAHGPFSVAVTAVAASVDAATAEVAGVARAQLARLPAR